MKLYAPSTIKEIKRQIWVQAVKEFRTELLTDKILSIKL